MDVALTFHEREVYNGTISVDGKKLWYDPAFLLKAYRESHEYVTRTYLHSVLHCVFHHPFVSKTVDQRLWNLATDIAVEATICELGLKCTKSDNASASAIRNLGADANLTGGRREAKEQDAIKVIRRMSSFLTAEKIYAALKNGAASEIQICEWEELFCYDDHDAWYPDKRQRPKSNNANRSDSEVSQNGNVQDKILNPITPYDYDEPGDLSEDDWKEIAEQIEMDIEMFAKIKGKYASAMIQNLRAVNRVKYDYDSFLKKFAAKREAIKTSPDEFDYIYYNYGLTHYGNLPLIEPLEYRDDRRIRDFVIAIDTSGSVAGDEVQKFIERTYNILSTTQSFQSRINVHIIQCDARIQSDDVIHDSNELEKYLNTMEIRGLGGTDFRPVFTYVDKLIEDGAFQDLRGLIYFTDGLGTYPEAKPDYQTAFVFIENGYNVPEVPTWAMKVVLGEEEI